METFAKRGKRKPPSLKGRQKRRTKKLKASNIRKAETWLHWIRMCFLSSVPTTRRNSIVLWNLLLWQAIHLLMRMVATMFSKEDCKFVTRFGYYIWVKVIKNRPSKVCGRQSFKNFGWYKDWQGFLRFANSKNL